MNITGGTTEHAMNTTTTMDPEDIEALCYYEQPPMTPTRFWLVTVFGSAVSFISISENLLLFFVFASRKAHRSNHNVYLLLLAFFDVFVSTAYICLMSVNVLSDYLVSPLLVKIWFAYMVPMITISHIAMTASSFLIIAASFERYCVSTNSSFLPFAQRNRKLIAAIAVCLGIISKGTICLEFEISTYTECAGMMTEVQMRYRDFVFNTPYHVVWRFWYRNFVTIFAPFFILAYLNIRIVKALQATQSSGLAVCLQLAGNIAVEQAKRKATARAATRTLVLVVCCYLVSNIINVLLTIWEHVDKQSLLVDYINLYAIAVDMVSLLTTLACAFRLPIYLTCQAQLRAEIAEIFRSFCKATHRRGFSRIRGGEQKTPIKADDHEKLMRPINGVTSSNGNGYRMPPSPVKEDEVVSKRSALDRCSPLPDHRWVPECHPTPATDTQSRRQPGSTQGPPPGSQQTPPPASIQGPPQGKSEEVLPSKPVAARLSGSSLVNCDLTLFFANGTETLL